MNDDHLNQLLQFAREEAELPSSFQRQVWQAIAADTARREDRWGWINDLLLLLARPFPAAVTCSLALLGGALAGAARSSPPSESFQIAAYAQSINPLAKAARR
jgi:hypothetical protein